MCGFLFTLCFVLIIPLFYSDFSSMKEGWAAAIATTSREEFFETARAADPHSYVVMFDMLEYYADSILLPQSLLSPWTSLSL